MTWWKWAPEAKVWWRLHSTWIFAVMGGLASAWLTSADLRAMLPAKWVIAITPPMAVLGLLLRVRLQAIRLQRNPEGDPCSRS